MTTKSSPVKTRSLRDLYERPGFLLRRAHQISVSIFLAEADGLDVTTTQYGVLVILHRRDNLDQIGLSKLVGLDRSTTALVVGKLENAGYVLRRDDPADRRRRILALTAKGKGVIKTLNGPARRARTKALSVFSTAEAGLFLALLQKFVDNFNDFARAPIHDEAVIPSPAGKSARMPAASAEVKRRVAKPRTSSAQG